MPIIEKVINGQTVLVQDDRVDDPEKASQIIAEMKALSERLQNETFGCVSKEYRQFIYDEAMIIISDDLDLDDDEKYNELIDIGNDLSKDILGKYYWD